GSEVIVVAEGETLVHIEPLDTEDPVSITGLVIERGENWLRIIPDGEVEAERLEIEKINDVHDKELLNLLAHFHTPNRAFLELNAGSISHLEDLVPDEEIGLLEGVVVGKAEKWIDIENEFEERFRVVPKWIDGPDKSAIEAISKTPLNSNVKLTWVFDERYRLSEITVLDDPNQPEEPENRTPSIAEGRVSPSEGKVGQEFVFYIHYLDPDGDKQEYVLLELDGEEHEMIPALNENQGVDYKTGVLYSVTVHDLEPGIHFYSFFASDGNNDVETESFKGPMIADAPAPSNTNPVLSGGNINPQTGNSDSIFNFTVTYYDADGDLPEFVDLRLDDFRFPMDAVEEKDPEKGMLFKVTLRGLSASEHRFSYITSDGIALAETEWTVGPHVEEAERKGELVIWAINEEKTQNGILRINGDTVEERVFQEGENLLEERVLLAGEYVIEIVLENGAIDKKVVQIAHGKITEIELVGSDDPDEDGLTNREEFKVGTNPNNADTDGDNLPDEWEIENQTNPVEPDAHEDNDGDLLNNLAEFQNGTKAYRADSDRDGLDDGLELTTPYA
ncbi:MAG: hypothetical protein VW879_17090, partial [Opitutae bacterium]